MSSLYLSMRFRQSSYNSGISLDSYTSLSGQLLIPMQGGETREGLEYAEDEIDNVHIYMPTNVSLKENQRSA